MFCLGLSVYTVLFNLYLNEVYSIRTIGSLVGISYLFYGAFSIVSGMLSDMIGPRRVLLLGIIILSGGIFGSVSAQSMMSLYLFTVVTGVGQALTNVMFVPLLTEHSNSEGRAKLFSIAYGTGNLFMFLGTFRAGASADFFKKYYSLPPVIIFKLVLFSAAAIIFISIIPLLAIKREKIGNKPKGTEATVGQKRKATSPHMWIYGLVKLFEGTGVGLTLPFINLFLLARFALSAGTISFIFSSATLFTVVMIFVNPFITRRVGENRIILMYQAVAIPCLLVLGLSTNMWITVAVIICFRALFYAMMPIQSKILMERIPATSRGLTNSIGFMASTVGIGAAGFASMRIVSHLGEGMGYLSLCILSGTLISVSVGIFFKMSRPKKEKENSVPALVS
ncbi:MFS transporter [Neobacillus piezotolerans]|uniref:MFS transporter n=1 Tax=Neobacillus piezotolerans TaxID=2259171 RepID=UPI0024829FE9|nr:MFS transporter [Neobacillus piezotolerans]